MSTSTRLGLWVGAEACGCCLDQVGSHLDEMGLNTLEKVGAASWSENLGLVMDGSRAVVILALVDCLRSAMFDVAPASPYLTWKQMVVLVGHCTFIGLLWRYSLSCFHIVYKFIQSGYDERRRLWAQSPPSCELLGACCWFWKGLVSALESAVFLPRCVRDWLGSMRKKEES